MTFDFLGWVSHYGDVLEAYLNVEAIWLTFYGFQCFCKTSFTLDGLTVKFQKRQI